VDEKIKETPDPIETKITTSSRQKIISWAVFLPTLVVVCINLITVIFPALITRSSSPLPEILKPDIINPFQTGTLSYPLIAINLILLGIGILYFKKKHQGLRRLVGSIHSFDLSKKKTLATIIKILAI